MFGISLPEGITVCIVVLVLLNPKDLPKIVRKLGVVYGHAMRRINGARKTYREFESELENLAELDSAGSESSRKEKQQRSPS
jgi:Sec-independent protein translocase protein TatA